MTAWSAALFFGIYLVGSAHAHSSAQRAKLFDDAK